MHLCSIHLKFYSIKWDKEQILKAIQMHFIIKINILVNIMDF